VDIRLVWYKPIGLHNYCHWKVWLLWWANTEHLYDPAVVRLVVSCHNAKIHEVFMDMFATHAVVRQNFSK